MTEDKKKHPAPGASAGEYRLVPYEQHPSLQHRLLAHPLPQPQPPPATYLNPYQQRTWYAPPLQQPPVAVFNPYQQHTTLPHLLPHPTSHPAVASSTNDAHTMSNNNQGGASRQYSGGKPKETKEQTAARLRAEFEAARGFDSDDDDVFFPAGNDVVVSASNEKKEKEPEKKEVAPASKPEEKPKST
ncbi:hypothetical protein F5Y18DRAFT_22735 [Xylariaceae sp. FL1019]|nr:hypothetical protein F5Y18DRAFT_22735 [Xylariaceae sp. FL1019]